MRLRNPSIWLVAALLTTTASCHNPPTLPLDQEFQMRVGGYGHFAKSDLDLLFRRVASDNRCPHGAECITAGTAIVTFEGRILKAPAEPFDVPLPGTDEPGSRAFDGYRVFLVKLEPEPVAGQAVDTTAYVATLRVVKR